MKDNLQISGRERRSVWSIFAVWLVRVLVLAVWLIVCGPVWAEQLPNRGDSDAVGQVRVEGSEVDVASAAASDPDDQVNFPDNEFAEMSLEELMAVEVTTVTSVAGVSQPLAATPAAVTVLTGEDIRRAGHRHVAEALRMVPGLNVARINSNRWAVTSRGFNGMFSNKLLVLIDGRSVYSPAFSGVNWDIQNVPLENIDRIEVIRGPGATLWGANAVNGVINIVTKSAEDTQGGLLSGGSGTYERGFSTMQYGFSMDEDAYLRTYAMYLNRDASVSPDDERQADDWDMAQSGFRFDWVPESEYSLTLQGDVYGGQHLGTGRNRSTFDRVVEGGNILGRLKRDISVDEGWSLQLYYDQSRRENDFFEEMIYVGDVDFRHRFKIGERHKILWGAGIRYILMKTKEGVEGDNFDPARRDIDTISWFVQDTVVLVPEKLSLMLGSKFECNEFTGFEFQPSARLTWTPHPRHTVWSAISRAVHTPGMVDGDPSFQPGGPGRADSGIITAESLIAYELGYRWKATDSLSFDVSTFLNKYDEIRRGDSDSSSTAQSYGVEVESRLDVTEAWTLTGYYALLKVDGDGDAENVEQFSPRHQAALRSTVDITDDVEFNAAVYYVDHLPVAGVHGYVRADAGLTWRPMPDVEFSVWGQNLFDDRHIEFVENDFLNSQQFEVERGVFATVKVAF